MKRILTVGFLLPIAIIAIGQGTVNFQNVTGTAGPGGSAHVTNILTGTRVVAGTTFVAQLYYGASGASANQLIAVTNPPIGFNQAGLFSGGVRNLDAAVVGICATGARTVTLQVRSWQASLGPTWESALSCSGNGLVMGTSAIFSLVAGNPCTVPAGTPANLSGLRGFNLNPCTPQPPTYVLNVNDVAVGEGLYGTNTAVFTVSLSPASAQTVTVNYATLDGTATAATDYVPVSGTVTFTAGQTNRTITVPLIQDLFAEGDEVFFLTLSNPTGGATLGRAQGLCTISDLYLTALGFHVDVSFASALNQHYRVESSVDTTNWVTVPGAADVLGTGGTKTIVHSNAACNPTRTYRVRLLP